MARGQVIQFSSSPPDHHTAVLKDELQRVMGRVVAHATVPLLQTYGGTTITLAGGAFTAAAMASSVDFGDAGIDYIRCVVFGTPPAHSVTVNVFNLTSGKIVASATMTGGGAAGYYVGQWTQLTPVGGDEQLQVRFVGTGAEAPVLNTIQLQCSTANAKP